jgi:hypothetical protein
MPAVRRVKRLRFASVLLAATLAGVAWASEGICHSELRRAMPPGDSSDGVVAVELLAGAVRLVEPALRPWRSSRGPIPDGERGAAAARFLDGVGLLPAGWSPQTHDLGAWQVMHERFAAWYRARPASVVGGSRDQLVRDMAETLASVSEALRPLAVFSVDAEQRVTFFAVIWNWTPRPRLLLLRPPDGLALGDEDGAASVLSAMSGCALRFDNYVYAREDLAISMFGQRGESVFRVLGSEPPADLPAVFGPDRVLDVFRFSDPALEGVRALSGGVEGPSIGIGAALRLLTSVRTNLAFDGILFHTAFP